MKVILQQDVKGQGKKGQMIEASDGYARNFLLPKKLAVPATAENVNTMKQQEKARKAQEAAENTEPEAAPAEDEKIEEEPIQLRGETKICPVCKAEVDGDALFCNHCGAQL